MVLARQSMLIKCDCDHHYLSAMSIRPLILALAICAASPGYAAVPASAPFNAAQRQTIQQLAASEVNAAAPKIASDAAASVAKTIEGEKRAIEVAKDALEVGRKSVDWWLSNIGVLMGFLGFVLTAAGIGIPYAMGLKKKAEWEEKLAELTQKLEQAKQHTSEIETLLNTADKKTSLIPNAEEITGQLSAEVLETLRKEKPPQVVKLIEQASDAHRKDDYKTAKPLWELLSLIESHDANVWFNLAYTESELGQDYQRITDCYQRSHLLKSSANTCNNWGVALSGWASSLKGDEQQQRFAEADQHFAEAISLRPNDSILYDNWSKSLQSWTQTLTGEQQQQCIAKMEKVQQQAKLLAETTNT